MGFITNSLSKSLFTEDSYKYAVGDVNENGLDIAGYAVIKIFPSTARLGKDLKDPFLIGIMKERLSFEIEANWDPLGGFAGVIPSIPVLNEAKEIGMAAKGIVSNLGNLIGAADLGAVYSSKLIYHKSGYLRIRPSFRVVDWDGTSQPLKAAFLASSYCVPFNSLNSFITSLPEKIVQFLQESDNENLRKLGQLSSEGGQLFENGIKFTKENMIALANKIDPTIGQSVSNAISTVTDDLTKDYGTYRSSPSPVQVTVGQYFYHPDMVVRNVSLDFSREMTKYGPLYVDVTLDLSSRKIVGAIEDMGFGTIPQNRLVDSNGDRKASPATNALGHVITRR